MTESPAHDAHVLDGLIAAVERSAAALQTRSGVPDVVRDQALARGAAVDILRAAGASRPTDRADGLLAKAQQALERFAGDTASASPANEAQADGGDALAALEREEQALQARFEAARADDRLSGPTRDAVLKAYDEVKPGHDLVRQFAVAAAL